MGTAFSTPGRPSKTWGSRPCLSPTRPMTVLATPYNHMGLQATASDSVDDILQMLLSCFFLQTMIVSYSSSFSTRKPLIPRDEGCSRYHPICAVPNTAPLCPTPLS